MTNREFTGFVMVKCNNGHTTRFDVGADFYRRGIDYSETRPCGTAGCERAALHVAMGKPLYGRYAEDRPCDGRCMGATGVTCDCHCGGQNHGGKWTAPTDQFEADIRDAQREDARLEWSTRA